MKILANILLLFFFLIGCSTLNETPGQVIETITTGESAGLIQENQDNPDFHIIDVRTPAEYTEAHIEDAINIDYNSQDFEQNINELQKSETYLIYCHSGNRSGKALQIFSDLGFKEVYNMDGGITKWIAEDRPVIN